VNGVIELPATTRVRLRRLRPDDAVRFDRLDRDDGVLRFIDWHPPTLAEQEAIVADCIADYQRWPNHGRFAAESPYGEFIGWLALRVRDDPAVPDLGYRLHRRFWGQGLATEGSRALIGHAFRHLSARAVRAETMWVNTASRRVMEKCGLRHLHTFHVNFDNPLPGSDRGEVLYEITRDDWWRAQTS
jgi:RimJ/RimL family protein N-acetyltransferase